MKQLLGTLKSRVQHFLEEDEATKDRPVKFRIIVTTLLAVAICCITYSGIRLMP